MDQSDYEAQKKLWYAKLKASGFADIELPSGDLVNKVHLERFRADEIKARYEYFQAAEVVLNKMRFYLNLDLATKIWERHVKGKKNSEIARSLKLTPLKVANTIKSVQREFNLKREGTKNV